MEGGRLTDLLLHPFVVAWNHGNLPPDAASRRAREALTTAAGILADTVPGRRPDSELAGAWAALGQG